MTERIKAGFALVTTRVEHLNGAREFRVSTNLDGELEGDVSLRVPRAELNISGNSQYRYLKVLSGNRILVELELTNSARHALLRELADIDVVQDGVRYVGDEMVG